MFDAEFHILCSEKPEYAWRIKSLFECGLFNCKKSKIKICLLIQNHPNSTLEKDIEKYQTDNISIEVLKFRDDSAAFKKFTYLTEIVPQNINNARWFIAMDDDTITDIDNLMGRLDEDFDWQEKYYVTPEPMKNSQPIEFDIACMMGKEHWYCPHGGPYHEWEFFAMSQKAMQTIIENSNSMKVMNLRKKILHGWGDHCMGLAARFSKIYPTGTNYISGNHLILEHTLMGGWVVHCHHIYKINNMKNIMKLIPNRKNGLFANKKIFLSEATPEIDKGFYHLSKNGVICGPPNHRGVGIWDSPSNNVLNILFFDDCQSIEFNFNENNLSKPKENQKQLKAIASIN